MSEVRLFSDLVLVECDSSFCGIYCGRERRAVTHHDAVKLVCAEAHCLSLEEVHATDLRSTRRASGASAVLFRLREMSARARIA